eukprot:1158918-Pelagomonas_calceolata.AAC.3
MCMHAVSACANAAGHTHSHKWSDMEVTVAGMTPLESLRKCTWLHALMPHATPCGLPSDFVQVHLASCSHASPCGLPSDFMQVQLTSCSHASCHTLWLAF